MKFPIENGIAPCPWVFSVAHRSDFYPCEEKTQLKNTNQPADNGKIFTFCKTEIARGGDGKTYYVPADMTYNEWEQAFVKGGAKDGLTVAADEDIIRLTSEEKRALNEYISSGSYKINAPLRDGIPLTEEQAELVHHLDAALRKMPTYQGTVYRSVSDFGIQDIEAFFAEYISGKKICFSAYTSCGTEVYDESFPIQYVIKSKNGRDIRSFNEQEFEILFPRNSEFKVTKVEGKMIYMEEV